MLSSVITDKDKTVNSELVGHLAIELKYVFEFYVLFVVYKLILTSNKAFQIIFKKFKKCTSLQKGNLHREV